MGHHYLVEVLVILVAALVCVPIFHRLRLGPVLGYLVAGIAIGPSGFGLVGDVDATRALAELGVVFLLFTIGLELTVERLRLITARIYGLGVSQVVVTTAVIAVVAHWAGLGWPAAVIIGGALALSSTAIVMPMLASMGQMNTAAGQVAVAILLLQDLAVGPLLVLIEALGNNTGGVGGGALVTELGLAVVKAAVAIGAIVITGRLILTPLFRVVAATKSPELFVGLSLLVALGTAWGTEQMGLSMAFGGFLAGLLLAETEFRHQVAADVQPFRGLLLGLFFMTVGMSVDLRVAVDAAGTVVALAVALMVAKTVVLAILARATGMAWPPAFRLGGVLSQGGEFAFVSFGAAAAAGILAPDLAPILIAVVVLTMAATPVLASAGRWASAYLEARGIGTSAGVSGDSHAAEGHIIIVGFGEIGRIVARMLRAYGADYMVLDLTPERIREARTLGEPVFFGDATQMEVLRGAGVDAAVAVVVATQAPGVSEGVAALRRHGFPHVPVLARGGDEQAVLALRRAGLTPVGQEATDAGLKLAGAVLDLWREAEIEAAAED